MTYSLSFEATTIIAAYTLYAIGLVVLMFISPLNYVRYSQWFSRDIFLTYGDNPKKMMLSYIVRSLPSVLVFSAALSIHWQAAFAALVIVTAIVTSASIFMFGKSYFSVLAFDAPERIAAKARF